MAEPPTPPNISKEANLRTRVTAAYRRKILAESTWCPMPGCGVTMIDEPHQPSSKEIDHIVPVSMKGQDTEDNVRVICRSCNQTRPTDGSDVNPQLLLTSAFPTPSIAIRVCVCGKDVPRGRSRCHAICGCGAPMSRRAKQCHLCYLTKTGQKVVTMPANRVMLVNRYAGRINRGEWGYPARLGV